MKKEGREISELGMRKCE